MQPDVFDYIEQLQRCATIDDAWTAIYAFAAGYAMTRVGCCYGAARKGRPLQTTLVRGNFSRGFAKRWVTDDLFVHDPIVPRAFASPTPFCWGHDYITQDAHAKIREFYAALRRDGARSMLVVPLRCDPARGLGFGIVANDMPQRAFEARMKAIGPIMALAIVYTDNRMTQLSRAVRHAAAKLAPREAQCLELLTAGLKNDAIAARMGITVHTVQLHLASAKRRLGAATREEAIAKAINFRLIRT